MRPQAAPPLLRLLTVNVNGLAVAHRLRSLIAYQQQLSGGAHLTFVQEAKLGSKQQLSGLLHQGAGPGVPWDVDWAFSPGSDLSCGTAILARRNLPLPGYVQHEPCTDQAGRVSAWDWDVAHLRLRFISVYAPAVPDERSAFFQQLRPFLGTDRVVLMGGDFNCVLDAADQDSDSPHRRRGASTLRELQDEFQLVDPWLTTGSGPGFTFPARTGLRSQARLDRWLISSAALPWVAATEVVLGAPGDHRGVSLSLRLPDLPPLGRPGWTFPAYLLYHPTLLPQLRAAVTQHVATLSQAAPAADPREVWEAAKLAMRSAADAVHRQHAKRRFAELHAARVQAQSSRSAAQHSPPGSEAHRQAALAEERLVEQLSQGGNCKATALDAAYTLQGEKGSAWFHSLGKAVRPRTVFTELEVPGVAQPVPLSEGDIVGHISAAAAAMYSSDSPTGLFRPSATDTAAQDTLLQHLRRRLPASLQQQAEGPDPDGRLTEEEVRAALAASANGKAPGSDGLPYEVYKVLWDPLGPLLLAAVTAAFDHEPGQDGTAAAAALPTSWLEGVITLIHKGRRLPKHQLPSYRPITLLNADYKLVCKALSNRLQPPLAYLVDVLQTAFLLGRWIGDNVLYHQALLEWLRQSQQPAALLFLDIEKAYDRVDRPWLHRVVQAMGFGPNMQRWLRLLTANGSARVVINGFTSDPFPVRGGLQQGSPLSPVLWVLQLEPLTTYLHFLTASAQLHTPAMPDGSPAPPASHHADDTTLLVSDADVDGPVAKAAVQLYCRASNAKENAAKGRGMVLGSHRPVTGQHAATGAEFVAGSVRHLGVPLGATPADTARECYDARIQRLRHIATTWSLQSLSMAGRVHIAKQTLGNSLAYHLGLVSPSPAQMVAARRCIETYVASSLLPEDASLVCPRGPILLPKAPVASLAKQHGGIGHIDLAAFADALRAKPLVLLALPGLQPWKALTRALLSQHQPPGAAGWGWVYGSLPIPRELPEGLRSLVEAYRATAPDRLPYPDPPDPRALLQEPIFGSPALRDAATGRPIQPPSPLPDGLPLTLGQLQSAPPQVQQSPLMQAVRQALPERWRSALLPDWPAQPALLTPTWALGPGSAWVRDPGGSVWSVLPSGRLGPAGHSIIGAAATTAGVPACVIQGRKPRLFWTLEERVLYDNAPHAEKAAAWPVEPQLLGAWEQLQCFPSAHGHGTQSLVHFTVANTRSLATHRAALVHPDAPAVPIPPAAWPPSGEAGGATAPTVARLQRLEAEWEASRPQSGPARFSQLPPRLPTWLAATSGGAGGGLSAPNGAGLHPAPSQQQPPPQLPAPGTEQAGPQQQQQPPLSPLQQQQQQQSQHGGPLQGPPPAPAPNAVTQCWSRLWECPASNRAKVLGWRLAHARLPCGLYLAAKQGRPGDQRHLCQHAPCRSLPARQRPRDSLSHVFLHCPAYQPARQWVHDVWVAVAGTAGPPISSSPLMLGDYPPAWPAYPASPALKALWQALRLSFLLALWSDSRAVGDRPRSAVAVVQATIREVQRLIGVQFRTAAMPAEVLDNLPTRLLNAQFRPSPLSEFKATWAHRDVLCRVTEDAASAPRLLLRLSPAHPVPVPADA